MPAFRPLILLVAAGSGTRFGSDKRFAQIAGKTLLDHALENARTLQPQAIALVVSDPERFHDLKDVLVVKGGAERQDSVRLGLEALAAQFSEENQVLIHDVARGLTPSEVMWRVLAAVAPGIGVVPTIPVTDSLKRSADGREVDKSIARDDLYLTQTPQGFMLGEILSEHQQIEQNVSDDASLFTLSNRRVLMVQGDYLAHKITFMHDINIAEALWRMKHA